MAGTLAALVASGEPVLVACADARRRRGHLEGRLGGFAVAAWYALERDPALVGRYAHVLALDPPASDAQAALVDERFTLAWGDAEAGYALRAHEAAYDVRPAAAAVYRALRDGALPRRGRRRALACGRGSRPARARRARRSSASTAQRWRWRPPVAPSSTRSAAFRAYTTRLAEGRARLGAPRRAARAA